MPPVPQRQGRGEEAALAILARRAGLRRPGPDDHAPVDTQLDMPGRDLVTAFHQTEQQRFVRTGPGFRSGIEFGGDQQPGRGDLLTECGKPWPLNPQIAARRIQIGGQGRRALCRIPLETDRQAGRAQACRDRPA